MQASSNSTASAKKFSLLNEEKFLTSLDRHNAVSQVDMHKLEVEYDFDTETEQLAHVRHMLTTDLRDAIEWFVCDDPLKIVNNLTDY